jgi:hypothetical protein
MLRSSLVVVHAIAAVTLAVVGARTEGCFGLDTAIIYLLLLAVLGLVFTVIVVFELFKLFTKREPRYEAIETLAICGLITLSCVGIAFAPKDLFKSAALLVAKTSGLSRYTLTLRADGTYTLIEHSVDHSCKADGSYLWRNDSLVSALNMPIEHFSTVYLRYGSDLIPADRANDTVTWFRILDSDAVAEEM